MATAGGPAWVDTLWNGLKRQVLPLLALIGMSLLCARPGYATTVPYKSFDQLVREAEGIIVGTVQQVESSYDPTQEIYTFVTLGQLSVLHGSYHQPTFVLRLKGGQVDQDILTVHGSPRLRPKDRVVLFVRGNGRAIVPVVGWTQGVFRILADAATGRAVVSDHEGNRILGLKGSHLIKEHRHPTEAHVIGQEQAITRSAEPAATPGSPDQGTSSETVPSQDPSALPVQEGLSVQAFMGLLQAKLARRATAQVPLHSVTVGEFRPLGSHQDVAPRSAPAVVVPQADADQPSLPVPRERPPLAPGEQQ